MDVSTKVLTDTLIHISEVREHLLLFCADLEKRGIAHDRTKLTPKEFDAFVSTRPLFEKANYGSSEYQECANAIKPAIESHYANNRHHTGFFPDGFDGMNLLDILEMLADWRAASRRSPDLTFKDSLPIAFKKYDIPENMQKHILYTLEYLNWIPTVE